MRVLIAAAKVDFGPKLDRSAAILRAKVAPDVEVVPADQIPWDKVGETEGSFPAAYKWSARWHDACVLVETDVGALGRGTFDIAREFLMLGKRVVVLRGDVLLPVASTRRTGTGMKQDWGAVVLSEAPANVKESA